VRIGSLFSGILGLELGLHWAFAEAGISTDIVWTVERDSFARSVSARWAPNAMQFDDVRMVGARELDQVDLISLGFPCTDISDAGKQEGIDGKASGLWSHGRRIIKELAPTFVVVENVAALHRRGLVTVLGNLAALGYDAEWHSFTASDVGAPHRRARMFIIAWRAMANGHGDGQRWQRAGDERDDRNTHEPRRNDAQGSPNLLTVLSQALLVSSPTYPNPAWVTCLMGFPLDWLGGQQVVTKRSSNGNRREPSTTLTLPGFELSATPLFPKRRT
jgi:DNA (cytosine-5)-methyltransferase 1